MGRSRTTRSSPALQVPSCPRARPWGPPTRHGIFGSPPPPRVPHRWGLGAYFVVEAVFLLVSALLAYALAGSLTSSAWAVALALSVPTVCAAALAAFITRIRGNGPRIDLGLTMTRRDIAVGVACGFAGLVITIPASVLYVAIVGADATSAVGEALGGVRAGPALAVLVFLIVVFVAPLCEEIVYRGLLWGAVERLGANRWWALGVTTLVFALAHLEFTRTPLLLVVAIPIGIARVITGRLPAGVIAHQINNLLPGPRADVGTARRRPDDLNPHPIWPSLPTPGLLRRPSIPYTVNPVPRLALYRAAACRRRDAQSVTPRGRRGLIGEVRIHEEQQTAWPSRSS